jgi:uncharacterized protein (DUF433 family)
MPESARILSARISVDGEERGGKPVIRGTRVAVALVLELLAAGKTEREILASYPGVSREDVLACLAFGSALVREFQAFPIPA